MSVENLCSPCLMWALAGWWCLGVKSERDESAWTLLLKCATRALSLSLSLQSVWSHTEHNALKRLEFSGMPIPNPRSARLHTFVSTHK
eukprot:1575544-Amphidinium_carterae.2